MDDTTAPPVCAKTGTNLDFLRYPTCERSLQKAIFYVKIYVKLPQVFTILREYSRNVRSAKFYILRENLR